MFLLSLQSDSLRRKAFRPCPGRCGTPPGGSIDFTLFGRSASAQTKVLPPAKRLYAAERRGQKRRSVGQLSGYEVVQRRQGVVQLEQVRSSTHSAVRLPAVARPCTGAEGGAEIGHDSVRRKRRVTRRAGGLRTGRGPGRAGYLSKKGGDVIPAFGKIGKPDYSASFLTTGFTTAPERRQRVHTLMVRTVPSAS